MPSASSLAVMTETAVSTPIWDFVLNYYGRKGVSEALIGLQDNQGIDVNMLLFLAWMAARGKCLAADDVKFVSTTSHAWQRSVVVPIRTVRRLLKENAPLVPAEAAAEFRSAPQHQNLRGGRRKEFPAGNRRRARARTGRGRGWPLKPAGSWSGSRAPPG